MEKLTKYDNMFHMSTLFLKKFIKKILRFHDYKEQSENFRLFFFCIFRKKSCQKSSNLREKRVNIISYYEYTAGEIRLGR